MITDWLMVAITAVYVVATIRIMSANKVSADASKKQLEESKAQFEEMRRLSSLPFLQIEMNSKKEGSVDITIDLPTENEVKGNLFSHIGVLRNIGNGTAMNIEYSWDCKGKDATNTNILSVNAIRYGDSYKVELFMNKANPNEIIKGKLTFRFQDLIGNEYEQKMYINSRGYDIEIDTDTPRRQS